MLVGVSTPTISHFENGEKDIQLSSAMRILEMLGLLDKRNLLFDETAPYYDQRQKMVVFVGHTAEQKIKSASIKKIQCEITEEALVDRYKSTSQDPIKIFMSHHKAIEQVARRKYLSNQLEHNGVVLIKTEDY